MNPVEKYIKDRDKRVKGFAGNHFIEDNVKPFMDIVHLTEYVKNWTWMGIPILQLPTDLMAMQEIICKVQPDVIIETGVAFGGMTAFYASTLELLGHGCTYGIDKEIRPHTREALKNNNFSHHLVLKEWDSVSSEAFNFFSQIDKVQTVLVSLDSNHTHDHVLKELRLYAPLVSLGSYIVVFDTSIEYLDPKYIPEGRPWGKGNSPMTAVREFLKDNDEFEADTSIEDRILLTSAPGGWLKRVKEVKH